MDLLCIFVIFDSKTTKYLVIAVVMLNKDASAVGSHAYSTIVMVVRHNGFHGLF